MNFRALLPLVLLALVWPVCRVAAQNSLTVSASPIVIAPPDSTAYTSGLSATTAVTVTLICDSSGNGGCQIDWTYGGSTFLLDYQITGASSNCDNGTNTATFASVPIVSAKLAGMPKNKTCTFTLSLRIRNLTITSFLSGVNYLQALTMSGKRLP